MSGSVAVALTADAARALTDEAKALMGPRRPKRTTRRDLPTDVYLFHDDLGALLYVGLSVSVGHRLAEHRHKRWWSQVSRIDVEHYVSRDAASDRERELIASLYPPYNQNGGGA